MVQKIYIMYVFILRNPYSIKRLEKHEHYQQYIFLSNFGIQEYINYRKKKTFPKFS